MRVYLAGGMKTEWRDFVKHNCTATFYDPCESGLTSPDAYTLYDLLAIELTHILFGYLAKDNPSGIGLALEVGYAKALGKKIIFVNEQEDNSYFDIVANTSDVVCKTLEEGIKVLKSLRNLDL